MAAVDRLIAIAKAEVGYHEGRTGSNWNNHQKYSPAVPGLEWSQNQAWCATFLSWCALQAGLVSLFPRTASTDIAAAWFKAANRWSEYPAVGAWGFLGTGNDMHHVFLVTAYDDTFVYTVEGNTNTTGSPQGDGVYALKRLRRATDLVGYGYPAFPEGIVSADPAWGAVNPVKVPVPPPIVPPVKVKRPKGAPSKWSKFLHLADYLKSDSLAGLKWGRDHGYTSADMDTHIGADGTWWWLHWGDLRGYTRKGRAFRKSIRTLNRADILGARSKFGALHSLDFGLQQAARLGYKRAEVEPKDVPTIEQFQHLKAVGDKYGIEIVVKRLSNIPRAAKCLHNAHAAGLPTMLLPRGTRVLSLTRFGPVTDYVRGPVKWVK